MGQHHERAVALMPLIFRHRSGFGLIEIVLALAILTVAIPVVSQLTASTIRSANQGRHRVEAAYLAVEGLEGVRTLRSLGWIANIATQPSGSARCLEISGGNWALTATSPCTLVGTVYTRTVTFNDVYRDSNHFIAASGTLDAKTKLVTATVTWPQFGGTQSLVFKTYITNHRNN